MELAPSSVPLSFEVTFDRSDLVVGMSVFDDTGSSPVLILGPVLMAHVVNYTYRAKFTGSDGFNYIIVKAVYTDGTFVTLDPNYSEGSESIVVQNIGGGSGGSSDCGALLGLIASNDVVVGLINC